MGCRRRPCHMFKCIKCVCFCSVHSIYRRQTRPMYLKYSFSIRFLYVLKWEWNDIRIHIETHTEARKTIPIYMYVSHIFQISDFNFLYQTTKRLCHVMCHCWMCLVFMPLWKNKIRFKGIKEMAWQVCKRHTLLLKVVAIFWHRCSF